MIRIKDPREAELFDRFAELLGPSAYRRMKAGWQGVFPRMHPVFAVGDGGKVFESAFSADRPGDQRTVFAVWTRPFPSC